MFKKFLVISMVLFAVVLVGGCNRGDNNENQIRQREENQVQETNTNDWQTYRNEEYGFEMLLPGEIGKWDFEIKDASKSFGIYNEGDSRFFIFNYPLDTRIAKYEGDPTNNFHVEMAAWYITITSVDKWNKNACENSDYLPCYQGHILGENSKYVFEAGRPNVEGAGYICKEDKEKRLQVNFCNITSQFYFGGNNFDKLNFKTF